MTWQIADVTLESRFFLGSAGYPSPEVLRQAIVASGARVVTLGLRRQLGIDKGAQSDNGFVDVVRSTGVRLLPNTAGCRSAREAVTLMRAGPSTSCGTLVLPSGRETPTRSSPSGAT